MKVCIVTKDGNSHSFECQEKQGLDRETIIKTIKEEGVSVMLRLTPSDIDSVVVE